MVPRSLVVALLVAGVLLGAAALVTGSGDYGLDVDDALDVPDRTLSFEGEEYEVTHVAVRDPGATFTVEVAAPDEQSLSVQVRNSDGDIQDVEHLTGSGAVTFDPADFDADPGAYLVTINADSTIRAVYPVLLESHDVSAAVPSSIDEGADLSVSATVTERADAELSGVRLVIATGDDAWAYDMSGSGDEYSVDVPSGDLDAGSYTVYVAAIGTETVDDTELPIGVSARHEVTVEEATATPTESSGGNGGGVGGGQSDTDTTATPAPTTDSDASTTESGATETATSTPDSGTATTESGSTADPTATSSTTTEPTASPTATDGPITPRDATDATATNTPTASSGQPGFTPLLATAALLLLAALNRARR